MRNIWRIYINDWKNVFKVSTGVLLVIAIIFLPSVYAWVNLKAMWDPYANTSGIKVAVTSEDQGTEVNGMKINIGDEVINSLKSNTKLGWTFVDRAEARRGIEEGDYYASLLIPQDFSSKIASILTANPQKPQIVYTVNEKLNAVATKITSSGATSLTNQISSNFIESASEAVLSKLKEAGIKLEEELPTIRNIENQVLELNDRLPDIEKLGNQALELEAKLPAIKQQGQKIMALRDRIPEINKAGQLVLKIEENLPLLDEAAKVVLLVQQRLPEIQNAADRIVELDGNFGQVENTLETALKDLQSAHEVIGAAQEALPKLEQVAESGGNFADSLSSFLTDNQGAFDSLAPIIKEDLILVQQIAGEVTQLTDMIRGTDFDPDETAALLNRVNGRINTTTAVLGRISGLLTELNSYLPGQPLNSAISRIGGVQDRFNRLATVMTSIGQALQQGKKPASDLLDNADKLAGDISTAIGDVLSRYDTEIVPNVRNALEQLRTTATNAADVLKTAQEQLPKIGTILADAQKAAEFGQEELTRLQNDLPVIRSRLHEAATTIQGNMDKFTLAVNQAADFVNKDLPGVKQKIHQAADFVRNDLPKAEAQFERLADLVENKFPEVENAIHQVAGFVREDLPGAESSISRAAAAIRQYRAQNDLGQLISVLKGDVQKESDFLGSPVELKEERLYPIPNYGSAMSPFYTTLSIWVGAMLLVSLFKVDVEDAQGIYKSYQVYFGRYLTFATIGIFQALSVSLGDLLLLGTYVHAKLLFVLSSVLISLVFVAITYTLVSVFGNIGKGLAVIFLVLQFSSSGGTFPVSTSTAFFQMLNPIVPFTYAVSLLREMVGGILPRTAIMDVLMLILFLVICFVVALILKKPLGKYTKRMAEKARETGLIP
ncbi:YhgE/Pip family protein [Paenibacillus terreus]|uniref:YhgE/Pip family protein n=1 Tax=Paenibacillus terreus TaxID=1387834 RepID=A0ABV5BEL5_9BACL